MDPKLIFYGVIPAGVALVLFIIARSWLKFFGLPTYEGYRSAHPDLVGTARVACSSCGGTDIFIFRTHGPVHMCRQCGKHLYRS